MVTPRRLFSALLFSFAALLTLTAACGGGDEAPAPTATARVARPTATGPTATIDPAKGPPGTLVTIEGNGWPAGASIDLVGDVERGEQGEPYETVTADSQGHFQYRFRLEKNAVGGDLDTGRYDIFARSGDISVDIFFLVEVRRPISGGGDGG